MASQQFSSDIGSNLSRILPVLMMCFALVSCGGGSSTPATDDDENPEQIDEMDNPDEDSSDEDDDQSDSMELNLDGLYDYANQLKPAYITKDNGIGNPITDIGATLGRVLFYDVRLSSNDTISCASCHEQALGFSDDELVSVGVNGLTERHSMRLTNLRFGDEQRFFWNERAESLEDQSTQPVNDHVEMGFSGENGAPDFDDLITKLSATSFYPQLFTAVFGNSVVTEDRIQRALSQFMRAMQSFDTRFDQERASVNSDEESFAGFSDQENEGKRLFMESGDFVDNVRQPGTGLGCHRCHRAPEFDIVPDSRNNGIVSVANTPMETDIANIRAPSLRGLFDQNGSEIGPFMHDGSLGTLNDVLSHYDDITVDLQENINLDPRLDGSGRPGGNGSGQKLQLTDAERVAVIAFLKTLSGAAIYTDAKFSDPFDDSHQLLDLLSQ